ncbi:MAG: hypothetical protein GX616_15995 [Planctomycetes bacterium]|nr:hypothetical protein [Planctomycetota bacterium]
MQKEKRSYFLPNRLVTAFDKEVDKQGYVREKVVAASIAHFMRSSPDARARMFEQLDKIVSGKAK